MLLSDGSGHLALSERGGLRERERHRQGGRHADTNCYLVKWGRQAARC